MNDRADRWIGWTTTSCVAVLALIAATVSYLHMHDLAASHGQPGWVAALTPLSVDGMIVAASTTLLAESRSGIRGGILPWALLLIGSVASLAANVAFAEPTLTGRVIAAWPSFALIGSNEMLMRQVRRSAAMPSRPQKSSSVRHIRARSGSSKPVLAPRAMAKGRRRRADGSGRIVAGRDLRRLAWQWPQANRAPDGSLPSGKDIASQFGRHERWGGSSSDQARRVSCRHLKGVRLVATWTGPAVGRRYGFVISTGVITLAPLVDFQMPPRISRLLPLTTVPLDSSR